MKREFLKDLGLTDEVIEKVMSEHGKDVQDVNSKLASAEQERDSFKSQVDDRDNQIKGLSDKADNNEELNSQIEKLQSTIKENWKQYESPKHFIHHFLINSHTPFPATH